MWKSTWKVNRNSTVNDDFFHDKQTSTLTIIIHYYWIIFNRIINIYDYYFKFFEWTMKWNEIKSKRRMKKKKKKKRKSTRSAVANQLVIDAVSDVMDSVKSVKGHAHLVHHAGNSNCSWSPPSFWKKKLLYLLFDLDF